MGNPAEKKQHFRILTPRGRLDAATSSQFEKELEDALRTGTHYIVFDCHCLDYISSAGFRLLTNLAEKLDILHGRVILCHLEDYLLEVFEFTGLDTVLPIEKKLEDALCRLQIPVQ